MDSLLLGVEVFYGDREDRAVIVAVSGPQPEKQHWDLLLYNRRTSTLIPWSTRGHLLPSNDGAVDLLERIQQSRKVTSG